MPPPPRKLMFAWWFGFMCLFVFNELSAQGGYSPNPPIIGATNVVAGQAYPYTLGGCNDTSPCYNSQWEVSGGTIVWQGTQGIQVLWDGGQGGSPSITVYPQGGCCIDYGATLWVNVSNPPPPPPPVPTNPCSVSFSNNNRSVTVCCTSTEQYTFVEVRTQGDPYPFSSGTAVIWIFPREAGYHCNQYNTNLETSETIASICIDGHGCIYP